MKPLNITFVHNRHHRQIPAPAITMILRYKGQEKYINTGLHVSSDQWNAGKRQVRQHTQAVSYNLYLSNLENKARSFYMQKMLSGLPFSLLDAVLHLNGAEEGSFTAFVVDNLNNENKLAASTRKQHKILIKYLNGFSEPLNFSSIDYKFIQKFENYLLEQPNYRDKATGLSRNYIATMLTILKKYTRLAFLYDKLKTDPFIGFQIHRTKTVKIELSLEEIYKLMKLDLSKRRGKVAISRDAFIFSCFTGLRYSDVFGNTQGENFGLRVKHFLPTPQGLRLQKITQKTKSEIDIPLYLLPFDGIPEMIAKKYIKGKSQNDLLFGVLDNNSLNGNIQSITKKAGIDSHITSHTARHTFSTNLQAKGVPLEVISALVGHSSVKTTEIYAKTNSNTIDNILRAIK